MSNSPFQFVAKKVNESTSDACHRLRMPLSWILLIVIDICLITFSWAQYQQSQPDVSQSQPQVTEIEPPESADDGIRFDAIDVFIDSGDRALAAWQFELRSRDAFVEIVGIEGGQHPAFAEPAYYDPSAMNGNRVILASFSTAEELPRGRTRVARIHLQCEGRNVTEYNTSLVVAADADGQSIPASMSLARATSTEAGTEQAEE